jgi:gamma-glutamyltranspeptidase / glutathione hydrolase
MPTHGAVASGHPSTTDAAVRTLQAGGNAMDAAVAAALTAGVCEPMLMGLGGGGLATVREGATGDVHVLFFFSIFPGMDHGLEPRDFKALEVDYGPTTQTFHVGRGAAAVPGTAPGLEALWKRWGSLPLTKVAEPAINLARSGWRATYGIQTIATMLTSITAVSPRLDELFNPGGRPLAEGMMVRLDGQVGALQDFAEHGAAPFVTGHRAEALLKEFGPPRGSLGPTDLASFQPQVLRPLAVPYRGATLYVPPPPCIGGALLAFGLDLLDRVCDHEGGDEIEVARAMAAVMAATERARSEGFDEDLFDEDAVATLLSEENLEHHARAARAEMKHSRRGGPQGPGSAPPGKVPGNTTHLSVVDADGNAVSLTASNGETCGHMWPGADIPVNNFLGEEDIHPLGFHRGPPGASFRTMMTPSLLVMDDGSVLSFGTGGANRIRTAMLQVVRHVVDGGNGVEAAVMEPRMHVEGDTVQVEDLRLGQARLDAISGGHRHVTRFEDRHLYFGGVHTAALRGDGTLEAFGDPRRSGDGRVL